MYKKEIKMDELVTLVMKKTGLPRETDIRQENQLEEITDRVTVTFLVCGSLHW